MTMKNLITMEKQTRRALSGGQQNLPSRCVTYLRMAPDKRICRDNKLRRRRAGA